MEEEIIRQDRTLSVVVPAYNEEMTLDKAATTIHRILEEARIPHELIFVDDGSTDGTWSRINLAAEHFQCVRGLRFSRNFGKEAAIMAGLTMSKGACTAVLDCDLQHPPEKLLDMYQLWLQGYQVVEGRKRSRGTETASHGLAAKLFYGLISKAAGFDMSDASDFKLLDRTVVDVLIHIPEKQMFFRAMSQWVGFPHGVVLFDVQQREAGESKWSGPGRPWSNTPCPTSPPSPPPPCRLSRPWGSSCSWCPASWESSPWYRSSLAGPWEASPP